MAGPWEQYQSVETGPWAAFAQQPEGDPIKADVRKEYDALKAQGVPVEPSLTRRVAQGATFGAADELLAGAQTPLEMIRRGTLNPAEGYKYAKAWQDLQMEEARKNQGVAGHVAEIAGGLGSGLGLARGGMTLARPGMGVAGRTAAMSGEGAIYGGTAGLLDGGNSLDERLSGAGSGALTGAAIGAALPAAAAAGGTVLGPIVSNIRARMNPQGVAASQVARAIDESGRPIADIAHEVSGAAAEGQPMYTVADALGTPGSRLLRTGISAQGPGRTNAVEFLEQRQAGQGRRVANTLAEGFDAPQTAAQTEARLTTARDNRANVEYDNVRNGALPVDLSRTVSRIDQTLRPGVNQIARPASGIADDSVESALSRIRDRLTDGRSVLTDFEAVQRVRGDLADAISKAQRAGEGNKVRLLTQVRAEMDAAMERASVGFQRANANFARGSRAIDAVDTGRQAATRGRTEDTIPAFRGMPANEQGAFRAGYVDPLIAQTQGGAHGVNKARPFTADAFRDEAAAIAPMRTGAQMTRRLDREQTMFNTRADATGGSRTDMNLADQASQKVDPGLIANIMHGNVVGLGMGVLGRVSNALHGYTPAVRENVVRMLLERGANPTTEQEIARHLNRLHRNQILGLGLARGAVAGSAVALPAHRSR